MPECRLAEERQHGVELGDLVDDGVVTAVAEQRVLVHEPSGEAFDLIWQVAVFHRGWTASCEADEETS